MMLGSTPAVAHETILPIGFKPRSLAVFSALRPPQRRHHNSAGVAAVTIPSFLNDGGNFSRISIVVSAAGDRPRSL
jgi:hypothetical protein